MQALENLKMKAGSEYQQAVAQLNAQRAKLDAEYEARTKLIDALAGLDDEALKGALAFIGLDKTPKVSRQVVTTGTTRGKMRSDVLAWFAAGNKGAPCDVADAFPQYKRGSLMACVSQLGTNGTLVRDEEFNYVLAPTNS